jgi:ABC-type transporter Mla subunit MlaD
MQHTQQLPEIVYILFTVVTAVGVMLQACVLLGIFLSVRKSLSKIHALTEKAEKNLDPILATTRNLLEDISPKLKIATGNLVEVSHSLRDQSRHFQETVDEILDKTHAQAGRVDEMLTGTLNTVGHATAAVQSAVATPVRHVAGVINGFRAGFDVLRSKERTAHAEEDGDHFV